MTARPLGSAKTRVARGARWLDENFEGWVSRIDIKTLRLSDGNTCICGQVFKKEGRRVCDGFGTGFDYAFEHLFAQANSWICKLVPKRMEDRAQEVSRALGFMSDMDTCFNDLQDEWVSLLKKRANA